MTLPVSPMMRRAAIAADVALDGAAGGKARELGAETRRVYAGAWHAFAGWCADRGWTVTLPVPAERLMAYVESLPASLGVSGVKLRLAAIAFQQRAAAGDGGSGPATCDHAAVRAAVRRRRIVGEGAEQATAVRLASCGEDLAGLRDRTLLLLVQVGGLSPADVAGLDSEDLRFGEAEIVLSVRAADGPLEQPGQTVRLARRRGDPLCPVQGLERWVQRSGIRYGAVFRAITVHGTLERRLGVVGVRRILRRIEMQAAAQAMPEPRMLLRGAWRKPIKGRGATKVHSTGASTKRPPARKLGPTS